MIKETTKKQCSNCKGIGLIACKPVECYNCNGNPNGCYKYSCHAGLTRNYWTECDKCFGEGSKYDYINTNNVNKD